MFRISCYGKDTQQYKERDTKRGFTLAEILIALVIVGVVSMITVPALINHYNDRAFTQLYKKERLTLLSALDIYLTDTGKETLKGSTLTTGSGVEAFLNQYLRSDDCSSGRTKACFTTTYKDATGKDANYADATTGLSCVKAKDGSSVCMGPIDTT